MATNVESRLRAPSTDASIAAARATNIGPWQLTQRIARGPLCDVYRARPQSSAGPAGYALKLLRPEWQEHPQAIALMRREAQVGNCVSHRHLVAVLSAQADMAPYFLVTPWLDGATLEGYLQANGRLPLAIALWIARQTAEALDALYSAGWMHGDIKPANVHIAQGWHLTLLDLGFARRLNNPGTAADRFGLGSASYLAPETITSRLATDIRSDIYSLGATLFPTLSGRPPYLCESLEAMVHAHRRQAPPRLRSLVATLPSEVAELVQAMLAKDPLRRPQTPAELVSQLVRLEIDALAERF
jgi:serine/threonine protein kinase